MMSQPARLGVPMRITQYPQRGLYRPARRGLQGPRLGQSPILENRVVSLLTNVGATVVGGAAGLKLSGTWSTVAWVLSVVGFLRSLNDLSQLQK